MVLMDWTFEIIAKDACNCGDTTSIWFRSHLITCPKSEQSKRNKQLILKWQKAFFTANPS